MSMDTSSQVPSVTADRKQALLLDARRARVSWVDSSTSNRPFSHSGLASSHHVAVGSINAAPSNNDIPANRESAKGDVNYGLSILKSSRACASMKSAVDVVSALYGVRSEDGSGDISMVWNTDNQSGLGSLDAGERIQRQLETQIPIGDFSKVFVSSDDTARESQSSQEAEGKHDGNDQDIFEDFAICYKGFLKKLRAPECAELVQGMRHFVHTFADIAQKLERKMKVNNAHSASDGNLQDQNVSRLVHSIHKYLETLYDIVQTHPLFMSDDGLSQKNKNMLETFIYSKCHEVIYPVLVTEHIKQSDDEMEERLESLQFVTPHHLDISYFIGNDGGKKWLSDLAKPISAIQLVDRQYSPGQMLSCILDIYKGVNDALKTAMEKSQGGKVPGADDVLPALILATICAKPCRIITNLRFIEYFATEEQMRGEAGYSFTNLYSAVQFIREINLEMKEGSENKGSSLSISPEELRQGLEKCRSLAKGSFHGKETDTLANVTIEDGETLHHNMKQVIIPVSEVRAARLNGENVNAEWAQQWQKNYSTKNDSEQTPSGETTRQGKTSLPLPEGFTRSYTYLAANPNDIRVSDIPQLLEEYRILVHTTEALLSERTARQNEHRKNEIQKARSKLESNAAEVVASFGDN